MINKKPFRLWRNGWTLWMVTTYKMTFNGLNFHKDKLDFKGLVWFQRAFGF